MTPFWARDLLRQHRQPAVAISAVICLLAIIAAFAWLPDSSGNDAGGADNRPLMVVVPSGGFSADELLETEQWLRNKNVPFVIASSRTGKVKSYSGKTVDVKRKIFDYAPQSYSGLVFAGGAVAEFKDKGAHSAFVRGMIDQALKAQSTVLAISNGCDVPLCHCFADDLKLKYNENGIQFGVPKGYPGSNLVLVPDKGGIAQMASWLSTRRNGGG